MSPIHLAHCTTQHNSFKTRKGNDQKAFAAQFNFLATQYQGCMRKLSLHVHVAVARVHTTRVAYQHRIRNVMQRKGTLHHTVSAQTWKYARDEGRQHTVHGLQILWHGHTPGGCRLTWCHGRWHTLHGLLWKEERLRHHPGKAKLHVLRGYRPRLHC